MTTSTMRRSVFGLAGLAVCGAVCMMFWSTDAQAASRYSRVYNVKPGSVLWLRSAPAKSARRVGFLPYKARHIRAYKCDVLPTGSWCKVRYRGARAWASGRYLRPDTARRA